MNETAQRLPPQNIEAEQSVLGAMLIDKDALFEVAEILSAEDFYREVHQKIFESIMALSNKGEPVDLVTVCEELQSRGLLDKVGGAVYLASLANMTPTAAHAGYYAGIVREKSVLRRLIRTSTEIIGKCYGYVENIEEFLDEAEKVIFEVARSKDSKNFVHLKDALEQTFERLERLYERRSGVTGLSTGFIDLDNITSGLQDSDLIIIAARPSMGKTTLALNIAHHIVVNEKKPVAFFSLEMSREQLAQRLLCAYAEIDSQKLRRGFLSSEEWPRLTQAVGPLSEAPLYIDDTAAISVMEMRAKSRRLKMEKGLSAIFVDYLQLMRGHEKAENRQQEISNISRALKALAKELNCPVVALSQLSRAVEQRPDKRPILSDLLESGGIEANADLVAFIYRDDYYYPDTEKKHITEIVIAKQRNGPTGKIELYFRDHLNKFVSVSYQGKQGQ
ncbi:MAG: replicative DNA helicase [Firmicutes bacterium]|jgi:replicative DNA helicase|nr:replicative DNA helicase [Bacillota bacterium]